MQMTQYWDKACEEQSHGATRGGHKRRRASEGSLHVDALIGCVSNSRLASYRDATPITKGIQCMQDHSAAEGDALPLQARVVLSI